MITDKTERENLCAIVGRLDGLTGTVRYKIPDALRNEIRECANAIRNLLGEEPLPPIKTR